MIKLISKNDRKFLAQQAVLNSVLFGGVAGFLVDIEEREFDIEFFLKVPSVDFVNFQVIIESSKLNVIALMNESVAFFEIGDDVRLPLAIFQYELPENASFKSTDANFEENVLTIKVPLFGGGDVDDKPFLVPINKLV